MTKGCGSGTEPYDGIKRGIDVIAAATGVVITAPLQLVIAVFIRARLGRPVLFRQARPGRDGRPFVLIKFRTMREPDPGHPGESDADRMIPLGSVLRTTSLDELPTLWNVLRGDMSLVGPRPLLMQYLPRYTSEQARRHEVRPGITGLAQVSGRNAISWDAKFAADIEYVDRRSFILDAKIIARTMVAVVRREGISPLDAVTMPEFLGADDGTRSWP